MVSEGAKQTKTAGGWGKQDMGTEVGPTRSHTGSVIDLPLTGAGADIDLDPRGPSEGEEEQGAKWWSPATLKRWWPA